MTTHELKTWPVYFNAILNGGKRFELRRSDRNFQPGDILLLNEWEPTGYSEVAPNELTGNYTGRQMSTTIDYVFKGENDGRNFGLMPGYCILSITPITPDFKRDAEYPTLPADIEAAAIKYCNENHNGASRTYKKCYESFIAGASLRSVDGGDQDDKEMWNDVLNNYSGTYDRNNVIIKLREKYHITRKPG